MFGRLPKLQTEIDVETNLSDCVSRFKSTMSSSGYDLVGGDQLMHQFTFLGRNGIAEVPGRFRIWAYGLGPRTKLVIGIARHFGLLPIENPGQSRNRLEQLADLLLTALQPPKSNGAL